MVGILTESQDSPANVIRFIRKQEPPMDLRWEFINENKKVRKQEKKKTRTRPRIFHQSVPLKKSNEFL